MAPAEALPEAGASAPKRGWLKPVLSLAVVAGLFAASFFLPVKDYLISFLEWTEGLGFWGPLVVAAFYVIACVLMIPGSVLTIGAGAIFGLLTGTLTVSAGSTLGACAAFVVGRTVARKWVEGRVAASPKFRAIDAAVGGAGFKIVLLLRLSPVFPFNLLNYGLGLTRVKFRHYALASWIGMLPGTVMYVYIGKSLGELAKLAAGKPETGTAGTAGTVFMLVGLVVTVAVTVFVTRLARKALKGAVGDDGKAELAGGDSQQGAG